MRNSRAALIAIICLLGLAAVMPALAKSGPLEVTYYYLPG